VFSVEHPSADDRDLSKDQRMKKQDPHILGIHNCTGEIGAELGNVQVFFSSQHYEHRNEKLPARFNARSK